MDAHTSTNFWSGFLPHDQMNGEGWNTKLAKLASATNAYESLTPPLVQTSTFVFPSAKAGAARFAGEEQGNIYTRLGNPTLVMFEEAVAALEGAEAGVAFASGMGAISATLMHLLRSGDHLLCSAGLYGSTFGLLGLLEDRFGISHSFSTLEDEEEIRRRILPNTKAVYLETPINPTLSLVDIELVSHIAHEYGLPVVVDNTFMTPYLQRPIELGADIVVHSATKYIGGHGDVIAGIAVGSAETMQAIRFSTLKDIGSVLSPFDAWLLLRGMRTLALRMDQHVRNAQLIADFLAEQSAVADVYFPGRGDMRQQAIAQKQMAGPGAMISFELHGGLDAGVRLMDRLQTIKLAVSLGDVHTLIQHPASMTHALVPREKRLRMGLSDGLIRLSVGIEDAKDIAADLLQALETIPVH